ncbi:MAG: DEAD/DEAH box helicase [Actinomycetia bacterium]|nr:DEAD/DEAH box helicase [Actinomycetes bacterium]MCP4087585.1 DEAD/DEAH box helicase [Actinomycetes bacterium]
MAGSQSPDFLAVATPGAGKTTFALTAVRVELGYQPNRRIIVVAPTKHLKTQWAEAAGRFDLHLTADWSASERLPSDLHGLVTTYQQVASDPAGLARMAGDAIVVLDEIHHAGDDRAWGDGVREAFHGAARRISLSGTPFRSDSNPIPFLRYVGGQAEPDFEYGYADALGDGGVVRPVFFPRIDGHMEWVDTEGSVHSATFADDIDPVRSAQRLRTALSLEGEWISEVLSRANERLDEVRLDHPNAGGLVIATDVEHARGIVDVLGQLGASARIAVSDDPDASRIIAEYSSSADPWLVAVRMVSEGVDIPRLRVGVYATTTTTDLFFRQAVGRFVRWQAGIGAQPAWLYIPDDPRLREVASRMAEQRRHSLKRRQDRFESESDRQVLGDDEQLSLFAALSSTVLDDEDDDAELTPVPDTPWAPWVAVADTNEPFADDPELLLDLAPAPRLGNLNTSQAEHGGPATPIRDELRRRLRDDNSERVRLLVRATGLEHPAVNMELNRRSGVHRVAEATVRQLQNRLREADRWLRSI